MLEIDKLSEYCQSVANLPCSMGIEIHQFDNEDDQYFVSYSGTIRYYRDRYEAQRTAPNSVTFNFIMCTENQEGWRADLNLTVPVDETSYNSIRYELENNIISKHKRRSSVHVQEHYIEGHPFALEKAEITNRRASKYTVIALARLAALTTIRMNKQQPE